MSVLSKGSDFSHIKNLVLLANADGDLSQDEVKVIMEIGMKDKGMSQSEVRDVISDTEEQRLNIPKSEHEKLEQIYDLVLVMLSDGIIENSEVKFCTEVAEKFGFRKTISALLVIYMSEYAQKELTKEESISLCRINILKNI